MQSSTTNSRLAHPFRNVNPPLNTQLPLLPDSMIHHSNPLPRVIRGDRDRMWRETSYYGVSQARRVLSPQLLLKRFDLIRQYLKGSLGLTTAQREVTLRLLRYWAYYGQAYPKEALVTREPVCSKATFWRTIALLEEMGLVHVINRHLTPFRRQISNLYRLDKLMLAIARYLAEHGQRFAEKWLAPALSLPGSLFWPSFWGRLTPGPGSFAGGRL